MVLLLNPITVITGGQLKLTLTLHEDGEIFPVDVSYQVTCGLRSCDRLMAGPVTCSPLAANADWVNGKVVCIFPASETVDLPIGAELSVEVEITNPADTANPDKWLFGPCLIVKKGLI